MDDGWSMDGWWKLKTQKIGSMNWIDYVMVCARLDYFWFLIENKSQKKIFKEKLCRKQNKKKWLRKWLKESWQNIQSINQSDWKYQVS